MNLDTVIEHHSIDTTRGLESVVIRFRPTTCIVAGIIYGAGGKTAANEALAARLARRELQRMREVITHG